MDKCKLFEYISEEVWNIISENHEQGNRLDERGITSLNIIGEIQSIIRSQKIFSVFAQKSIKETKRGGDLELYVEKSHNQFHRILLQSKIMEINGTFKKLNKESGRSGIKQYDTLSSYAKEINSKALYLMYNGYHGFKCSETDCAGNHDEKQYGCAILEVNYIKTHCEKNINGVLGNENCPKPYGKPWRFLTCCIDNGMEEFKLYRKDEIDMDPFFKKLFAPEDIISYATPQQFGNNIRTIIENNSIHKKGWNPAGRVIISQKKMEINPDGTLEI